MVSGDTAMNRWDAHEYRAKAGYVAELGMPAVELLNPQAGEDILDLGCGDGRLTATLRERGCRVVGVDASAEMVAAAQARGLDAREMDAQALALDERFDAVFSNAALHWMPDADSVIRGVASVLKPGGRFVGEFGGHGNIAAVTVALKAALRQHCGEGARLPPWYFPAPEEYAARLTAGGFRVRSIELIPRPTRLDGSPEEWLDVFAAGIFAGLPDKEQAIRREVLKLLEGVLQDAAGIWTVDYVRLRFAAFLE